MKFDFHIHGKFSDGTESVSSLVDNIIASGVDYFAITDHDDIKSITEMKKYSDVLAKNRITFVSGIEFSCAIGNDEMHILGYCIDEKNEELIEFVAKAKEKRRAKRDVRVAALKDKLGITLTSAEEKLIYDSDRMVGSIDFARILIARGCKDDMGYIIKKIIKPITGTTYELDAAEAISAITSCGGIASLAHPRLIMKDCGLTYAQLDELTASLVPVGLSAIEVYHTAHSKDDFVIFSALADKHGLLCSGGSDYHGGNKPSVKIGQISKMPLTLENCEGIDRFIDTINRR